MTLRSLFASLLVLQMAAAAEPARPTRTFEELVAMPLVHRVPGIDRVTVRKDLRYTPVNDPNLLMDVYAPPGLAPADRRAVVVFIHGGGSSAGRPKDWGYYQSWGRTVAASGLVGVAFTHRLGYPAPHLQEAADDVAAALDYVRENAAQLNADADRIALVAVSAGGPLLSFAMREKPRHIRALVSFNTFLDVQHSDPHRQHEPPERVRAFSCITYLDERAADIAPMFIARGGVDEIPGINDSIDRFMAKAIPANANITFVNHPQGDHTFVTQKDDERSREIIRNALDFLQTHLRAAR